MCKSAEIHMSSCISACGNTPKIVDFPTCENTHFWCISTCGNSSGKVNFRMSIYKGSTWVAKITLLSPCHDLSQFSVSRVDFYGDFMCRVSILFCHECRLASQIFRKNIFTISFMQSLLSTDS